LRARYTRQSFYNISGSGNPKLSCVRPNI